MTSSEITLPVVRAADLCDAPTQRPWLIDSLWAASGVGILGGPPKCCKSWLALDMALSVATDTPCLDTFAVHESGPVLVYMAEDPPAQVKARLMGLCVHRGLSLDSVPLHLITVPAVRLDLPRDQQRLSETVRALAPRLLVLDPFVRLHRIDENNAGEVSALLAYLRALQREHDLAVCVVHHARKSGGGSNGLALRGSGDFYAWVDSGLYVRRLRGALVLSVEHRAAPAPAPLSIELVTSTSDNDTHLALADASGPEYEQTPELDERIVEALTDEPMSRTELRQTLRIRNQRLGDALERLAKIGRVVRIQGRWTVPVPAST